MTTPSQKVTSKEKPLYGMSRWTPKLKHIDLELADVGDILQRETEKLARKEAEKKESSVLRFIDERGFKKLFFKRWLFVWCDMKGLNL